LEKISRRTILGMLVTGAAGWVGVSVASAAKKVFDAGHELAGRPSALPESIHDHRGMAEVSPRDGSDGDLYLAQYGSVRRSCRRTARRTARRTTRRVNRRQEMLDDD